MLESELLFFNNPCLNTDNIKLQCFKVFWRYLLISESKEPGKPQESGFSPKKFELSVLLQLFRHFPYNENLTRAETLPHSNAVCHQLELLTGGEKKSRMRMKVQGCLIQMHFIEIHQVKKK